MIKNILKYTISLPLAIMFGLLFMITIYITFGFLAALIYVLTGFDAEAFKYAIHMPNDCKDIWIEMIKDLID